MAAPWSPPGSATKNSRSINCYQFPFYDDLTVLSRQSYARIYFSKNTGKQEKEHKHTHTHTQ